MRAISNYPPYWSTPKYEFRARVATTRVPRFPFLRPRAVFHAQVVAQCSVFFVFDSTVFSFCRWKNDRVMRDEGSQLSIYQPVRIRVERFNGFLKVVRSDIFQPSSFAIRNLRTNNRSSSYKRRTTIDSNRLTRVFTIMIVRLVVMYVHRERNRMDGIQLINGIRYTTNDLFFSLRRH